MEKINNQIHLFAVEIVIVIKFERHHSLASFVLSR